jgi:hypothetical protein
VNIWTSGRIQVRRSEAALIAAQVSVQALAYVGAVVLNAFERIRMQILLAFVSIGLMVPLVHFFIEAGQGITAVPISAAILTVLPMLLCNFQARAMIAEGSRLRNSEVSP